MVSAWTVTCPALPVESGWALLAIPVNWDAEGSPTIIRRLAVTVTAPASPGPKVELLISPVSRSSMLSAWTVTVPALPGPDVPAVRREPLLTSRALAATTTPPMLSVPP
jgi:hypothetical protein